MINGQPDPMLPSMHGCCIRIKMAATAFSEKWLLRLGDIHPFLGKGSSPTWGF